MLEVSPIAQKEVVFLTDLQAASWRPPAEAADALKRAVARLEARRPRSVVIDLGKIRRRKPRGHRARSWTSPS